MERGVVMRRREREVGSDRVLDIGVYVGGVEVKGRSWDWVVGLDHRPIEMEVEVIGVIVEKEEDRKGMVDGKRFEGSVMLEGGVTIVLLSGNATGNDSRPLNKQVSLF